MKNVNKRFEKTTLLFIGLLCTVSFISCQKNETRLSIIKVSTEVYYFNAISKMQLFPVESSLEEIEKTFSDKEITIKDNTLKYSGCLSSIVKRSKKSIEYFNGEQNVKLYNDIISEFKLNIGSKIDYIELLYPDNECDLPTESFFQIDNDLFFVYKGYIVLYSKTKISNSHKTELSKLICGETTGNIEKGFITECHIKANLNDSYILFLKESKVNEVKYLKEKIPVSNIHYELDNNEIKYEIDRNRILVTLFFTGGITTIEFIQKQDETKIVINSSPD